MQKAKSTKVVHHLIKLDQILSPSQTTLRQLLGHIVLICVLSLNGRMTPNSAASHEIIDFHNLLDNSLLIDI